MPRLPPSVDTGCEVTEEMALEDLVEDDAKSNVFSLLDQEADVLQVQAPAASAASKTRRRLTESVSYFFLSCTNLSLLAARGIRS